MCSFNGKKNNGRNNGIVMKMSKRGPLWQKTEISLLSACWWRQLENNAKKWFRGARKVNMRGKSTIKNFEARLCCFFIGCESKRG